MNNSMGKQFFHKNFILLEDESSLEESNIQEYEVEKIMDVRERNYNIEYRIKWLGYDETTWKLAENVSNALDLLLEFGLLIGR